VNFCNLRAENERMGRAVNTFSGGGDVEAGVPGFFGGAQTLIVRDITEGLTKKNSDGIPVNASGESEIDRRKGKKGSGLSGRVKSNV
jgi:hypothetical protein